ncbi:MAG: Gfo/Idh/MocA family oxidoreductase [Acidobacteria bacterium]|nr:Gfo/Idh/MocA family oxidoreductase [Acidobacteriota bacterium]MCI0718258.1 Gfo/Idh/MocA family oxidoreductase [Acidobacteriota bacterium]
MINVGVIGYGYWGPNLVRNFSEVPGSRVAAVCDQQPERLVQLQARYPIIKTTTDPYDLYKDASIDAILIATPVSSHFDLAMKAVHAGKHVLVEKPMTATVEQGERLLEEAARCQRVLMVDHTFVYTGAVRKMKELVETGQLGQLYYYDSVRVNLGLFQHDVNVLWDLAVHDLSIMDYVLNARPTAVAATGMAHVSGQPKDLAYLTCFFDSNLMAHFHVNWLAPVKVRRTLIGGDRRMIVYDDLEVSEKIKVYDKGITLNNGQDQRYQLMVGYRSGDMWAPQLESTEALRRESQHFVECIEKGQQPLTDGEVGLRVVRILEAATHSLAQRGRPLEMHWEGAVA